MAPATGLRPGTTARHGATPGLRGDRTGLAGPSGEAMGGDARAGGGCRARTLAEGEAISAARTFRCGRERLAAASRCDRSCAPIRPSPATPSDTSTTMSMPSTEDRRARPCLRGLGMRGPLAPGLFSRYPFVTTTTVLRRLPWRTALCLATCAPTLLFSPGHQMT